MDPIPACWATSDWTTTQRYHHRRTQSTKNTQSSRKETRRGNLSDSCKGNRADEKGHESVACHKSADEFAESSINTDHVWVFHLIRGGVADVSATVKIAGSMQKSTDVMKMVNRMVKLPEIAQTMQNMSQEMMKVLSLGCCVERWLIRSTIGRDHWRDGWRRDWFYGRRWRGRRGRRRGWKGFVRIDGWYV